MPAVTALIHIVASVSATIGAAVAAIAKVVLS